MPTDPTSFLSEHDLDYGPTLRGLREGLKVFGRYTLTRQLGRGGMGVVWLARDGKLDLDVALKFLPETLRDDKVAVDELRRETKRCLHLTHDLIVRTYDLAEDGEMVAIAMEFVDGSTLAELRLNKPSRCFDADEIEPWLRQIIDALSYAHQDVRLVHRDLKPSNIMLNTATGRVKLADFGIASSLSDTMSRLTRAGANPGAGTLVYMSPQQLMGFPPAVTDDVYSLGATLYELFTSKPPFFRGSIERQIESMTPPSMAERRAELNIEGMQEIPEIWEQVISACLDKDVSRRPPTVMAIWEWLCGRFENDLSEPAMSVGTLENDVEVAAAEETGAGVRSANWQRAPAASRRKPGLIALVALLIMTAIVAGWWFGIEMPRRQRLAQEQAAVEARLAKEKADAEEQQRQLMQAEQARRMKIDSGLKTAQTALAAARFADARSAFQEVLSLDPGNVAAKDGLRDADKATMAEAEKMQLKKIDDSLKTAQAALTAEHFSEARKAYQDVLALDAANALAKTGILETDKAEKEAAIPIEDRLIAAWRAVREKKSQDEVYKAKTLFESVRKRVDPAIAYQGEAGLAAIESIMAGGGVQPPPERWPVCRRPNLENGNSIMGDGSKCWGYIDRNGKVVIPFQWDHVWPFYWGENWAGVQTNDQHGFIDVSGSAVSPLHWDQIGFRREGLSMVVRNNVVGYIDQNGSLLVPLQWEFMSKETGMASDSGLVAWFQEGLVQVKTGGKWGFIDRTGKIIIPIQWESAGSFSEGLAPVKKNGKYGYIDRTGKVVIPFQWTSAGSLSEGLAQVTTGEYPNAKYGFIDRSGKFVIPPEWDLGTGEFHEGLAVVAKGEYPNEKYGFIDRSGNIAIPLQWSGADSFSDGLASVRKGTDEKAKDGFIDRTGREVIPLQWNYAGEFTDGLAPVAQTLRRPSEDDESVPARMCYINKEGLIVWSSDGKGVGQKTPP